MDNTQKGKDMLNRFLRVTFGTFLSIILTFSFFTVIETKDFFKQSLVYADNSGLSVEYAKIGATNYIVKFVNEAGGGDIYGISSKIIGGSNIFGANTKYIPVLAFNAEVDWSIAFATPPRGAVTALTSVGSSDASTTITTVFF